MIIIDVCYKILVSEKDIKVTFFYSFLLDIITSLIDIFDRKTFHHPKLAQDEKEKILHLVVMCLYSFIDTPGAKIIRKLDSHFWGARLGSS